MPQKAARMVHIPGGNFLMGSDHHYPEEAPTRLVNVSPFDIDAACVTNDEFASFVDATGYITTCEQPLSAATRPNMPDAFYSPGSLVFRMTDHPVRLDDPTQWWEFIAGACWKHPEGQGSTLNGRGQHPVVHVSLVDALRYAQWAGKTLPSEEQWEYAANTSFNDASRMNIWRGSFPTQHDHTNKAPFTVPAHISTPPKGGLHHMLGNVWEWTTTPFDAPRTGQTNCCSPEAVQSQEKKTVLKGGSHLCADSYCRRYRASARIGNDKTSSASHIGFRCIQI
ncbi:MAG: SUMF1/EgtB/PvdO family nonheme iron enzyme [Litoreibacter sp.]